jgi:hypothetical protein
MSTPLLNTLSKDERFRILSEKFHFSGFRKIEKEGIHIGKKISEGGFQWWMKN